jgi:hypothetical protein
MNKIKLEKLILKNFKGIKDLTLSFEDYTNIKGDNATGKTSIFDAFIWLLFDKDSADRQSFDIKTLDCNNEVIHGLEHQVSGTLKVNGKALNLTKIFKEKWTKKKGEAERLLTGHETLYYIEEVPVKQGEYKAKVNSLIDENIFKLITNTLYFSVNMKWQDRRKVLIDIIGDIAPDTVLCHNIKLKKLGDQLLNREVEDIKKSIAAIKRKLNEEIRSIPYRINELNNSIVELDYEALEVKKLNIEASISSLEDKLLDRYKVYEEALKEKDRLYLLKAQLKDMEYTLNLEAERPAIKLKEALSEVEKEIFSLENAIDKYSFTIQAKDIEAKSLEEEMNQLRKKIEEINQESFFMTEEECVCPTCLRALEQEAIKVKREQMQENFNKDKLSRVAGINKVGKLKSEKVKSLNLQVMDTRRVLESCKVRLQEKQIYSKDINESLRGYKASFSLEENMEYQKLLKEISTLEEKLQENDTCKLEEKLQENEARNLEGKLQENETSTLEGKFKGSKTCTLESKLKEDEISTLKGIFKGNKACTLEGNLEENKAYHNEILELKNKKSLLNEDLEAVNKQLSTKEHNERTKTRIQELTEEERALAKQIADLENQEFLCVEFIKTKVELLEGSINNKFKFVTFKLFNTLVNGAVEDCCEALINGVPFGSANKASQINAGLDIINALSKHYEVQAPIFIDNRESINEILDCDAQIINLIVNTDKDLVVEYVKKAPAAISHKAAQLQNRVMESFKEAVLTTLGAEF